ncbi:hypothetical protein FA13DRAFT_1714909 [Coprinellus micaceus]|uniref:Uncharacterized protein n=1 Tax=Coprinellus micaceus TaxID=71717 RepID=A0A4Y7SQT3_COPMI|nr:hypothetical protein FA13DRAFT_1714909 [Coprinellus micaceus]
MASPPLRLDSVTAQQWPSCYHYCAIRIYFAISAWNNEAVLKEVAWASTVGTIARGHGAVLEHGRHQGRLVAEVTNIMLHKECAANPTDLRNFLARWESGAGEWRTTLLPWWDSLPSVDPDETFTSLANLIDIFNREIAVGGLPVPDVDWVIRSHLPEEQQSLEQLQRARFWARQTVALTVERVAGIKAHMKWHQFHHWMSAHLVDMAWAVSQEWERLGMASPRSTADRTPWVRQMHLQLSWAETVSLLAETRTAVNRTEIISSAARILTDKDILTAQALFNFYAHRRNVIVAFPSTAAPWWDQPNGPWPRPTLQTWIDGFLTSVPSFTEASERYMAQAMDPSAPTTDLLGEGIVDVQMGMHVIAKRRQEVERRLDELEQVILDVEPNALITGREGMRKMAEIIRDWHLGIH